MAAQLGFRTPRVISALVLREMSTTYGRSIGGYFWAVAEPVAGIVLLTICFGLVLRSPPMGTSFALFYASGVVPFFMYNTVSNKVAMAIKFSRPLLVYPRVTFFDAVAARFILNGLTQVVVAYVLLTAILMSSDTRAVLDFGKIGLAITMALSLGFSIGCVNCLLFAVFPTWQSIWSVLNRPAFLVSGIFFTFEDIPPAFSQYLWYNPLIHVTGQMRRGIYPTYVGEYISIPYVMIWAALPAAFGLFFLRRYHKKILNEL